MGYLDGTDRQTTDRQTTARQTTDRQTTDARRLGAALRALQQRSGCTLRDLESRMPISDSSLSRYFRGQTVPPWTVVQDLCRALGADAAEYRALWEAAERNEPRPPVVSAAHQPAERAEVASVAEEEVAEVAEAAAPAPAPAGAADRADPRAAAPRRRVWRLPGGRRACTLAGALAGAALGAVLTWFLLPSAPGASADGTHTPRAGSAAERAAGTTPPETGQPATGRPAPADTVRIFVSRRTGACLDHSLDKRLRTFPCNGMSYQRWTLHRQPDGALRLRNHATGACLAHGPDGPDGLDGLDTAACSAAPSQKWAVTSWPDDSVEVRSKATGACLDDSAEAGLRALPCARTDHQRWG